VLTAGTALLMGCHSVEAKGTIVGQLLAAPGAASRETAHPIGIAGQQVMIVDAIHGYVAVSATTDSDGGFRLSLPAGRYVVQSGNTKQYVRVRADEQIRVNLMAPIP
jgi:hypothetical protein